MITMVCQANIDLNPPLLIEKCLVFSEWLASQGGEKRLFASASHAIHLNKIETFEVLKTSNVRS